LFDRLVDIVLQFVELGKFWYVCEPFEAGVKTRLGRFVTVLEPGFHWCWPLGVDRVVTEHTVPRTHMLGPQSATTKDGKQIGFEAVITVKVNDIRKALLEVEHSEDAVKDSCAGTIGQVLSTCEWRDIISDEAVLDKITAACRKKGFRFGLEVMSVQFSSMALTRSLRLLQTREIH
jgi:regulator of protease activity HflC (stomatin/prohibitin superfamily)